MKYKYQAGEGKLLEYGNLILTTQNLVFEKSKFLSTERIICPLHEIKVINGKTQAFIAGREGCGRRLEVHFSNGCHEQFNVCDGTDARQLQEVLKWIKALNVAVLGSESGEHEELEAAVSVAVRTEAIQADIEASAQTGAAIGSGIASVALGGGFLGNVLGDAAGSAVGGILGGVVGMRKGAKEKTKNQPAPPREKVSRKCSGCGSLIAGQAGMLVRCPYCDTTQRL